MIKRVVKLTFKSENINTFKEIFRQNKNKIASSPGCLSVELLQCISEPHVFFTFSIWNSEDALNNYRHSELFRSTWTRTKILFSEKPEAWSVNSLERIMG